MIKRLIFGMACLLVWTTPTQAAAIVQFEQIGGGVVGTLSGSLDLTGMIPGTLAAQTVAINASFARLGTGVPNAVVVLYQDQITGPDSFGFGGTWFPNSSVGDAVFLAGDLDALYLPVAYTSGSALSATMTFAGHSFGSLGVSPGDSIYTLASGDTFTVRFADANTAVPEPASMTLLGSALAGLGLARRRKFLNRTDRSACTPEAQPRT